MKYIYILDRLYVHHSISTTFFFTTTTPTIIDGVEREPSLPPPPLPWPRHRDGASGARDSKKKKFRRPSFSSPPLLLLLIAGHLSTDQPQQCDSCLQGRKCNAVGARVRIESIRKEVIIDGILKTVWAVVIKRAGPSAPWRSPLNVRDYIWPRRLVRALPPPPSREGTAVAPLSSSRACKRFFFFSCQRVSFLLPR